MKAEPTTQAVIACPVCGGAATRLLWKENLPETISFQEYTYTGDKRLHGRIHRCGGCGHGFTHPIPSFERSPYHEVMDVYYLATERERIRTFEDYLNLKERFEPAAGKLLDVGCYAGTFLDIARGRGYDVEGIEPSTWGCSYTSGRNIPVRQACIEDLDPAPGYDYITAFDVLEHLETPLAAVQKIHSLLNPGGVFVASVPDMGAWHARLLGRGHWLVILMHYHYFISRSFELLLKKAGFDRILVRPAPPSRIRLANAANHLKGIPLVGRLLGLAVQTSGINRLELKLHTSLFGMAWKT